MEDLENIETIFDHCKDKKILRKITILEDKEIYLEFISEHGTKNYIYYDLYKYYKNYKRDKVKADFYYNKIDKLFIENRFKIA